MNKSLSCKEEERNPDMRRKVGKKKSWKKMRKRDFLCNKQNEKETPSVVYVTPILFLLIEAKMQKKKSN